MPIFLTRRHRLGIFIAARGMKPGFYLETAGRKASTSHRLSAAEFDVECPNPSVTVRCTATIRSNPTSAIFDARDRVIRLAARRLVRGLLPTRGDKVELLATEGPHHSQPENARPAGEWTGRRHWEFENIIWINAATRSGGGTNTAILEPPSAQRSSRNPSHLMTFIRWRQRQAQFVRSGFHRADWLDLHLAKSGPEARPASTRSARDYSLRHQAPASMANRATRITPSIEPCRTGVLRRLRTCGRRPLGGVDRACGQLRLPSESSNVWMPREPVGLRADRGARALTCRAPFQMKHLRRSSIASVLITHPDDSDREQACAVLCEQ